MIIIDNVYYSSFKAVFCGQTLMYNCQLIKPHRRKLFLCLFLQVMKLKLELVTYLASNSKFSKTTGSYCLSDLVDKIGDVKNGYTVQEALSCIAEVTSLEYVSEEVRSLVSMR